MERKIGRGIGTRVTPVLLGSLCLLFFGAGGIAGEAVAEVPAKPQTEIRKQAERTANRLPIDLDLSSDTIERRLMSDVEYLASEELEGRGPRSKGLDLAADHIAHEFEKAGLFTNHYGGPFHEFRLLSANRRGVVQSLTLTVGEESPVPLKLGQDFTSLLAASEGKFSLPVVFVGYGIRAEDLQYDDYVDLDVKGKAVLMLRHEPQRNDPKSRFDGTENSPHAFIRSKIRTAVSKGAAAVILCTGSADMPDSPDDEVLLQADVGTGSRSEIIPVVHLRRSIVEKLIRQSISEELASIESGIDETLVPRSRELPGVMLDGVMQLSRGHRNFRNVVASLEGNGPLAEETVILGAHYDHLGRESWGSLEIGGQGEIHYGADDNASGTAVLMEVARQLGARSGTLKRRVLFIAFTAEEMGLIGSKNYVQDPLFPLDQTVAMLNLDMVGRLRGGKLTVYGVETSQDWAPLIQQTMKERFPESELKLSFKSGGYGPSDHASFYEKGVPVLHFFTGFHPEYHRPADVARLINGAGMRQVSELVTELVVQVANREERPSSRPAKTQMDAALQMLGETAESPSSDSPPRIGVHVEPGGKDGGIIIRRIVSGGMAEKNGLRTGDVILKVDNEPVRGAADIRAILEKSKESPTWTVLLKREGILREVTIR